MSSSSAEASGHCCIDGGVVDLERFTEERSCSRFVVSLWGSSWSAFAGCKYGISYPAILAEMMQERGVEVAPSTIMLWVHRYAPELEKRVRWYQGYRATCWRVDETYVKVGGNWKSLFRAVDKHGRLIDFHVVGSANTRAAHRFPGKALTTMRHWPPSSITTDQLGSTRRPSAGYNEKASWQPIPCIAPASTSTTSSRQTTAPSSGFFDQRGAFRR
jgi:transposase-like protein